jgi:hypothetical protein
VLALLNRTPSVVGDQADVCDAFTRPGWAQAAGCTGPATAQDPAKLNDLEIAHAAYVAGDIDIDARNGRAYVSVHATADANLSVLSKPDVVSALQELDAQRIGLADVFIQLSATRLVASRPQGPLPRWASGGTNAWQRSNLRPLRPPRVRVALFST